MTQKGRKIFKIGVAATLVGTCGLALAGHAEDAPAGDKLPLFDPAIKRVAVFKNGYVFTFREGEVKALDGWAATTQPPTGVLGTVWAYSMTPDVSVP